MPITALIAIVSGFHGYVSVQIQEKQLIEEMVDGMDQLSKSITSATWHAMLADYRDDAYQVMRKIGQKQGIESIRFFNKEGDVTFSTDPNAAKRVDKNADACFLCHAKERPLVKLDMPSRARSFYGPKGDRKLAMVTPIYNEKACSVASCHAHPEKQNVLGVLDISKDIEHVNRELRGIKVRTLFMTLLQVVMVGVIVFVVTRRSVTNPIRKLIGGTKAVSEMDLDRRIEVGVNCELEDLADSFNIMRERLKSALDEINDFTKELENRVEERSNQLNATQEKLIQSDRLASLGRLAASVAHEINNPISGILNFSMLAQRLITKDGIPDNRVEDFQKYLEIITRETGRVGKIVSDMLLFSRRSSPQKTAVDLNETIERTVSLISHKLQGAQINLKMDLDQSLPNILCDRSQLQQVIINLIMNASEATAPDGTISVRTSLKDIDNAVLLEVSDTGHGIPDEILSKIFDPFVSTKDEGKGVGLGLAVVYGIVDAHDGNIELESEEGKGTTFKITIPVFGSSDSTKDKA